MEYCHGYANCRYTDCRGEFIIYKYIKFSIILSTVTAPKIMNDSYNKKTLLATVFKLEMNNKQYNEQRNDTQQNSSLIMLTFGILL